MILISEKSNGHLGKSEPLLLSYLSANGAFFEHVVEGFRHQLGIGHNGIKGAFYKSRFRKSSGPYWLCELGEAPLQLGS